MELVGRSVGWLVGWFVRSLLHGHSTSLWFTRGSLHVSEGNFVLYALTGLRVKTRVRIFHRKKHKILWNHIKGVLFTGQCPVNTVIHKKRHIS